jgi:Fic family protein
MPDWDKDSPELQENLLRLLRGIRNAARDREALTLKVLRRWHQEVLHGLTLPDDSMAGKFRGERGLEDAEIRIGAHLGVSAANVKGALHEFEQTLKRVVSRLDALISAGEELDSDQLAAVVDFCAWAHAEWIRIHPFANGNGRIARTLANAIAMRYGIPPFVRLRPRPDGGYGAAGEMAMRGNWKATAVIFQQMLLEMHG